MTLFTYWVCKEHYHYHGPDIWQNSEHNLKRDLQIWEKDMFDERVLYKYVTL